MKWDSLPFAMRVREFMSPPLPGIKADAETEEAEVEADTPADTLEVIEAETEDEANDPDVIVLPYAEPRPVSDVKIAPPTDEQPFPTPKKWARLVVNTDTLRVLLKTYPLIDDTNFHDGLLDELQDAFVEILRKRGYIKEDQDDGEV